MDLTGFTLSSTLLSASRSVPVAAASKCKVQIMMTADSKLCSIFGIVYVNRMAGDGETNGKF